MALKTVSCIAYALCTRRKGDTLGLVLDLPPTISPVDPLVNRDPSNKPKVPGRFPAQPPFFPPSYCSLVISSHSGFADPPRDPGWQWVATD